MKAFAKAIGAIFMILGVIIIMVGFAVAISGFSATPPIVPVAPTFPGLMPDLSGLALVFRLIAGGAISLQGLFLLAIGEVLWLLAIIAEETQWTSEYLSSLSRRENKAGS